MIRHANGIVVGAGARVGEDCTILQQVTVGVADAGSPTEQAYPEVGDSVVLGAGAKIIGGISVGNGAVVGANSVVTRNVGARTVVVGAPARMIATV